MKLAAVLVFAAACGHSSSDAPPAPQPQEKPHHHEDRHDPQGSATGFSLDVTVDGAHQTWTPDTFAKVPHLLGKNKDGEARDVWSLREVASGLVGSGARVVSITGDVTKAIGSDAWADATRIPIVHSTRRGTLKFRWADKDGAWGDTEVKEVTKLEIQTR